MSRQNGYMSPALSPTPVIVLERPIPGVTVVRLNRPERLNAMTTELVEGLHQVLDRIAIDAECRVVILTGAGRGFCAGLDLTGYGDAPNTEDFGAVQRSFAVQKHIASLMSHMQLSLPSMERPLAEDWLWFWAATFELGLNRRSSTWLSFVLVFLLAISEHRGYCRALLVSREHKR